VNSAIKESTVSSLGVVVMDELHMLDDDYRGYLMEIMATKLLSQEQSIQMIGMSATVSVSPIQTLFRFTRTGMIILN
jgi:replicative superfamily II helicase